MSFINTILKCIGLERANASVAKELKVKDPPDCEVEDILAANVIPKKECCKSVKKD